MTNVSLVSDAMEFWQASLIALMVLLGAQGVRWNLHKVSIRRHQAKLDSRLAAGEDRYFEELRELEAYDPRKNPPWKNVILELGTIVVWFGLAITALMRWDI